SRAGRYPPRTGQARVAPRGATPGTPQRWPPPLTRWARRVRPALDAAVDRNRIRSRRAGGRRREGDAAMATFVDPLRRAERVARRREALVCGDVRLDYAELLSRCRRLVAGLAELGTGRGDRVAVLAANSIPYVELYCTTSASGRVQVPLNIRWAEPELAYALEDSGAKVLFTDRDPGPLAALVERVVRLDLGEYEDLLAGVGEADFDDGLGPDDLAGLFSSGGTTGAPQGARPTAGTPAANAYHGP